VHHVERAIDVHVEHATPVFVRAGAVDVFPDDDSSIVHQDAYGSDLASDLFRERGARLGIGHIEWESVGLATTRTDLLRGCLGRAS
jgi:hypothetical protein